MIKTVYGSKCRTSQKNIEKFLKEIISNCSTMLLVVKLWRMLENTLTLRLQQLIDKEII